MSNELTVYEPRDIAELRSFSQEVCATELVPQNYRRKPADAMVAMMYGKETAGLGPLTSLQYIAVINGRPAFYGDALPGIAFNKKMIVEMDESFEGKPYDDDFAAVCVVTRPSGAKVTQRFSVADAKAAGLWTKPGPWKQYPKRMLQWRARSWAIRDAAPHMLFGPTYEELRDAEEHLGPENAKDVTPQKPPRPEQPLSAPEYHELYSAHGEEFLLEPGQVEAWIAEQIAGATAEEIEQLAKNNPERGDVQVAVADVIATNPAQGTPRQTERPHVPAEPDPEATRAAGRNEFIDDLDRELAKEDAAQAEPAPKPTPARNAMVQFWFSPTNRPMVTAAQGMPQLRQAFDDAQFIGQVNALREHNAAALGLLKGDSLARMEAVIAAAIARCGGPVDEPDERQGELV